ncbi:MAG TPA: hypothetical protein VER08_08090 [Pyrinomonadaceae bacterium]|nr:hypothetical protein [Pyrinomonadaceae bacterium]
MSTQATFVEEHWREPWLALARALNQSLGRPALVAPTFPVQEPLVRKLGDDLAARVYRPDVWFEERPGEPEADAAPRREVPPTQPEARHLLLCLRALEPRHSAVSLRFGGVVYEDPFYATLACYNLSRWEGLFVLPVAASPRDAWGRRARIVEALAGGTYRPDQFFASCRPIGGAVSVTPTRLLSVTAEELTDLRERGTSAFAGDDGIARYSLYAPG